MWRNIWTKVCDEVGQDQRLESSARLESDTILTQFYSSFCEPFEKLRFMQYALQWVGREHNNWMALEVWPQLAGCSDESECELLQLSVSSLSVEQ